VSTNTRKTRIVEYWADLCPGWHKNAMTPAPFITNTPPTWSPAPGSVRVRVLVSLPEVEVQEVAETLQAAILTDEPVTDPFEAEKEAAS
jgi:hypothetical protein